MVEPPEQNNNIINGYRKLKSLGEGSYGEADLVMEEATDTKYAMKILRNIYKHL